MGSTIAIPKFALQVASAQGDRTSVTAIEADYQQLQELHQELNNALLQARVCELMFKYYTQDIKLR